MYGVRNPLIAILFAWIAKRLEARVSKTALTH